MKIKELSSPQSLEEAYMQLRKQEHAVVLGGGVFLKLQRRTIPYVIDLSHLGLNKIEEDAEGYQFGAMVTLRQIEINPLLPDALRECVRQIGGVALRNLATVGGSVMGRYPFSDVMTALMAINATLHFHRRGSMPIQQFADEGLESPDILVQISVPKATGSLFAAYKPVYTDFSLVNLAVSKSKEYTVSIGARPAHAKSIVLATLQNPEGVLDLFTFSDDRRASGAYRRALAKAMLEDALKEAKKWK